MCDFAALEQSLQSDILYRQGTYLGKRNEGEAVKVLYQLNNFYIEVVYHKYRCHIDTIICFDSTDMLDPYLENISIEALINC